MNSIRVYLIMVTLALVTLFNSMAAIHGYQSAMAQAEHLFDSQLLSQARLLSRLPMGSMADAPMLNQDSFAFQIWQQGQRVFASDNSGTEPFTEFEPGLGLANFAHHRWRTAAVEQASEQRWVLVAQRMDERYLLAESVVVNAIWPLLAGLPILALVLWFAIRHGLKPLNALARALSGKQASDLGPIRITPMKQEIGQIVLASNRLLARLETSLNREKQFAADAAHEMRTPLSVLKIQLHNLRTQAETEPRFAEQLDTLAHSLQRFEHVIEQILLLYRTSPDQYHAHFAPIELHELVQEVLAALYPQLERKGQQLTISGQEGWIQGDRFALTTLLQNLVINAIKYTPAGGQIRVAVLQQDKGVGLLVEDDGPGIPDQERALIFERFYRVGRDCHQSREIGCGLGLAIVARIAELHGARVEVADSAMASGTRFVVWFQGSEP